MLRCLPVSLGALTSLTRLDASRNRLEYLPPAVGSLARLAHLDVHSNRLPYLPQVRPQLAAGTVSITGTSDFRKGGMP